MLVHASRWSGARAMGLATLLAAGGCDAGGGGRRAIPEDLQGPLAQAQLAARSNPQALPELGRLQMEAGLWFEAADTFLRAKQAGIDSVDVYAGMANTYMSLGYLKSSVDALRSCFSRAPQHPDCIYAFGRLLEGEPSQRARRELQRTWARFLLLAPPDHPRRGYVASALAQLDGQLGPLVLEDRPASQPATTSSTVSRPALPDQGEAPVRQLNPFGQAIKEAYEALGRRDGAGAIAAFQRALALQPDDPTTLAGLAIAQIGSGDLDAAEASAEKAWRLGPKEVQVRYAYGLVMKRKGRLDEAKKAWSALLKDAPEYGRELGLDKELEQMGDEPSPSP